MMETLTLLDLARNELSRGDKKKTREYLRQIIAQDKLNEEAWLVFADASQSRTDEYLCLQNVIKINPNNSIAIQRLQLFINNSPPPQEKQRIIKVGRQEIINKVVKTINGMKSFEELDIEIPLIEQSFFVPSTDRKLLLINGWEYSIKHFLEDGLLDSKDETRLVKFKDRYNLSQEELDINGAYTRIAKASIIRDVLHGIVPEQLSVQGNLPINFQKGEKIIWAFSHSDYLEDKTLRTYVGASKGVSVRIMKGVYYRVGAFQGKAIEHVERVHIDNGWVVITNNNIYFAGTQKSVRIPYIKIISFEPFSNGIGIICDSSTAKPQIFVTGDGWFTYNLVTNLAKL